MTGPGRIFVNGRALRSKMIGINRYTSEILKRLDNHVELITPNGIERIGRGIPWEQFYLPRRLQSADLLWSPANTGPLGVRNQVLTIHDTIPFDHPEWCRFSYQLWHRLLQPALVKKIHALITVSEFSKNRIIQHLAVPENRITVIPEAADPRFTPASKQEQIRVQTQYQIQPPFLLALGSLDPRKNLPRLLQAWKILQGEFPEYCLVIAGEKSRSGADPRLQTGSLHIRLIGYVNDCDLPGLYSSADAFIFPSLYEGFGLPALEAMACGTPVITSDRTALPEVVGDAGILFDPEKTEELVSSIRRILCDNSLRERLVRKGFDRASRFSWDTTSRQVWRVLVKAQMEI